MLVSITPRIESFNVMLEHAYFIVWFWYRNESISKCIEVLDWICRWDLYYTKNFLYITRLLEKPLHYFKIYQVISPSAKLNVLYLQTLNCNIYKIFLFKKNKNPFTEAFLIKIIHYAVDWYSKSYPIIKYLLYYLRRNNIE